MLRPKTYLIDIDGTIARHNDVPFIDMSPLLNSVDTLKVLRHQGHKIILVTARNEKFRERTIDNLNKCGIIFDQLVMGVTSGQRVLINDLKPNPEDENNPMAVAINVERNKGFTLEEVT